MRWSIVFFSIIVISVTSFFFFKKEKPKPIVLENYATWCEGEKEYFDPGETVCYSITRDGEKIATTTVTSGLKFFGEISTTTDLKNLANALDALTLKIEPDSVSILDNDEYEIHTKIGNILLQKTDNIVNAIDNINTFIQVHKNDEFEYIDVRHGNNIFFKLKNEKR